MEVEHFAVLAERLEAVGESCGDVHCSVISLAENFGVPIEESGRPSPKVYRDVEDCTSQAADQFGVRMRGILPVHSPHCADAASERAVDLRWLKARQRFRRIVTKQALEVAAGIDHGPPLDHE